MIRWVEDLDVATVSFVLLLATIRRVKFTFSGVLVNVAGHVPGVAIFNPKYGPP